MANRCHCSIRIEGHPIRVLVASDAHYGIGRRGEMLFRIPSDLRNFKMLTLGKTVFMGRRTWEATPPLPGRRVVVLSRREVLGVDLRCATMEDFLSMMRKEGGFLIGGGEVITALIHHVSEIWLTQTEESFSADTRIPNPLQNGFYLAKESPLFEEGGLHYRYRLFRRYGHCC